MPPIVLTKSSEQILKAKLTFSPSFMLRLYLTVIGIVQHKGKRANAVPMQPRIINTSATALSVDLFDDVVSAAALGT